MRTEPNRFERRPWITVAGILAVLLGLTELGLRALGPSRFCFIHEARQVHRYSPRWSVELAPLRTAHLRISDNRGGPPFFDFQLTANQYGFRTSDRGPHEPLPPAGAVRWVHAIGDSYTMGWGVDFESSYPSILDRRLPEGYRVLNLGVDGFGTIAATEKSMELARRFPPWHVFYLFSPNDFSDDARATALARRGAWRHGVSRLLDWTRRHSYLANTPFVVRSYWQFRGGEVGPPAVPAPNGKPSPPRPADLVLEVEPARLPPGPGDGPSLRQMARYARFLGEAHARLTVLILSAQPESLAFYRYCLDNGIDAHVIELPPKMRLPRDGHFNEMGNDRVARLVETYLMDAERGAWPQLRPSSAGP